MLTFRQMQQNAWTWNILVRPSQTPALIRLKTETTVLYRTVPYYLRIHKINDRQKQCIDPNVSFIITVHYVQHIIVYNIKTESRELYSVGLV